MKIILILNALALDKGILPTKKCICKILHISNSFNKNLNNILPLYNFTLDNLVSTITQYEGRDVISHFEILLSRKLTSRVAQYSRRDVTYPSIVFVFWNILFHFEYTSCIYILEESYKRDVG